MTTKMSESPTTAEADGNRAGLGGKAVLQVAERLHSMEPEWVVFFREVLGVDGIVRRTFRDPAALVRFE